MSVYKDITTLCNEITQMRIDCQKKDIKAEFYLREIQMDLYRIMDKLHPLNKTK